MFFWRIITEKNRMHKRNKCTKERKEKTMKLNSWVENRDLARRSWIKREDLFLYQVPSYMTKRGTADATNNIFASKKTYQNNVRNEENLHHRDLALISHQILTHETFWIIEHYVWSQILDSYTELSNKLW